MAQDPRIGTELAGFRILSVLGRGGMSVVYLAEQAFPQRKVALKLVAPELAEDERFRERFIRESNIAASLDHPNVLPIYAAGEADGVLFIAMRHVDGTDLRGLIRSAGRLSVERTSEIVSEVAGALDQAHDQGLVHRDVKPANVLIASGRGPEDRGHVYLSDFGLTKRTLSGSGLTGTGQFVGSIEYAAPEQFQGRPLDARTDTYSLGCVVFECLTGNPPFPREQEAAVMYGHLMETPPAVSEAAPGVPPALDPVVAKAMAKDPDDRYQRAGALAGALRQAATDRAPAAEPAARLGRATKDVAGRGRGTGPAAPGRPSPVEPAPSRLRERAFPLSVVAVALIVVVALVAWFATRSGTPAPARSTSPPPIRAGRLLVQLDPSSGQVVRRSAAPPFTRGGFSGNAVASGQGGIWVVGSGGLTHIDPSTGQTKATIRVGGSLSSGFTNGVAVGPRSVWAVSGDPAGGLPGVLTEVNPATDEVLRTVRFGTYPTAVAVGLSGVWTVDATNGDLSQFAPDTMRILKRVNVGGSPADVVVGEGAVWVSDPVGGTLTRYDPRTGASTSLNVAGADGVAVGFGSVWVIDSTAGTLTQIDPSTGSADTRRVGNSPNDVAVGAGFVWVANSRDGTVSKTDPRNGTVTEIRIGGDPRSIAADDEAVWVVDQV